MSDLKYTAQECKDIRGLPPRWYDFDTLAITYGIGHTDAMFIAAASPDVVLGLLADLEKHRALMIEHLAVIDPLKAERDRLREALRVISVMSEGCDEIARQALEQP